MVARAALDNGGRVALLPSGDMLSRRLGRERFRMALKAITTKYAGGKVSWAQFLDEIQEKAGEDLGGFYQQWFDRGGCPRLSLTWHQEDNDIHYSITQTGPPYRLELPIQIELADGSALVQTTTVEREQTNVTLPVSHRVYAVRLDPHFEVLHATAEAWSEGEALRYFTRGQMLWDQNKTPEALATFQDGLEHLPEVDSHGVEFLLRKSIGWIHQEADRLEQAKIEYERALALPVRPQTDIARVYLNIALIAQKSGDRERMVWAARNALSCDRARGREGDHSRQALQLLQKQQ